MKAVLIAVISIIVLKTGFQGMNEIYVSNNLVNSGQGKCLEQISQTNSLADKSDSGVLIQAVYERDKQKKLSGINDPGPIPMVPVSLEKLSRE